MEVEMVQLIYNPQSIFFENKEDTSGDKELSVT